MQFHSQYSKINNQILNTSSSYLFSHSFICLVSPSSLPSQSGWLPSVVIVPSIKFPVSGLTHQHTLLPLSHCLRMNLPCSSHSTSHRVSLLMSLFSCLDWQMVSTGDESSLSVIVDFFLIFDNVTLHMHFP